MSKKTVFITGVSSGLGRAFANALIDAGYTVVGNVRRPEAVDEFEALRTGRAHGRVLDVKNHQIVKDLIANVEETVGAVDVLINNAGYGHEGILEESSLDELRDQF